MGSVRQSQIIGPLIWIHILTVMIIYIYIYNCYGSSQQFKKKKKKNSKIKSKIGCYQIYLLKKIKEIAKTQGNFYIFGKTK